MATLVLPMRACSDLIVTKRYFVNLQILSHQQINKEKWDACIRQSSHPLLTAESWYLDLASPHWMAIILDDYKAVMPVPIVKKMGLSLIVQPLNIQQLGIFSATNISKELANAFYRLISRKLFHLNLNNKQPLPEGLHLTLKQNYILHLNTDCQSIKVTFSQNCLRNIKKANGYRAHLKTDISPDSFIQFTRQHAQYPVNNTGLNILKRVMNEAIPRKNGFIIGLADNEDKVLAMAFFLKNNYRITFLSGVSSAEGMKSKSMFKIINHIIENNCNQQLMLDFEGSSIESIARFYKGFGSSIETYYQWQHPLMKLIVPTFKLAEKIKWKLK